MVAPLLLLIYIDYILMGIPAFHAIARMEDTRTAAEMVVKVTASQWKWQYEYPEENIRFISAMTTTQDQIHNREAKGEHYLQEVDNPLILPTNRKIRILLTSTDVIHSWWVPALAVKKDAIPGFVNESWTRVEEPGLYRGQCAELCGKDHGFMPIVVEVKSKADFATWLAERKQAALAEKELTSKQWSLEELLARGEKAYNTTCAACHQPTGEGLPPMFPALKGSPVATGPAEGHIATVVNGRPGTAMAAFGKQLSEVDLAAIITYERNAWGNKVGDMVTPQDIVAFKQAQE